MKSIQLNFAAAAVFGALSVIGAATLRPATAQDNTAASATIALGDNVVIAKRGLLTQNGTRPGALNSRVHILPTQAARAEFPHSILNKPNFYGVDPVKERSALAAQKLGATANAQSGTFGVSSFPAPGNWSPIDMVNFGGVPGNVYGVQAFKQENIYVNCNAHNDSCWVPQGSIKTFENALSASTMISITNQYVKKTTTNRYPQQFEYYATAGLTAITWPGNNFATPILYDADAQAIALAAAVSQSGYGYGFIYHVFVPPGTDVCFDGSNTVCYSSDYGDAFYFCGYHGSFDDGSGHHILYSVEPYNYVGGCHLNGQSATDAQVNVLSHETFEAITDPDPNYQWNSYDLNYGEIGDMCAWRIYNVPLSYLKRYNIQLEYSNLHHECAAAP